MLWRATWTKYFDSAINTGRATRQIPKAEGVADDLAIIQACY